MVKFSTHWKSSSRVGKQRKYHHNAPLHIKQKLVHAHLSPVLREKYGVTSAQVRVGDKVKVMRGSFALREAKVEKVELRSERLYVVGCERVKKDGNKVKIPIHPSKVMIVDLDLGDKKRSAHFNASSKKAQLSTISRSSKVTGGNSKQDKGADANTSGAASKMTKVRGSTQ